MSDAPVMSLPTQLAQRAVGVRQTRRAVVSVVKGRDLGLHVVVDERPVVVGSSSSCDLVLSDPLVSRRHLRLSWDGRWLQAQDMGSTNGAFSGDNRFDVVEAAPGGTLRIGETVLTAIPELEDVDAGEAASAHFGAMVGASAAMRSLFSIIERTAASDASVLITGETGVGKELVAEELHRRSSRRDRPLVVVDCGAVPGHLVESLLFGHARGAFTGAVADRTGLFEEADGGTLFLDEIGELDTALQPRLLRVLDRGTVQPVGEARARSVDVRVIAATHRDLAAAVAAGTFRGDLFHRLSVVRLHVPPLRERPDDITLLVRHLLRKLGGAHVQLTGEVAQRFARCAWPGNVRELGNVLESSLALMDDGVIDRDTLERAGTWDLLEPAGPVAGGDAARAPSGRVAFAAGKAALVQQYERQYLRALVKEFDTISAAARAASMDRKQLRILARRYGLRFSADDG